MHSNQGEYGSRSGPFYGSMQDPLTLRVLLCPNALQFIIYYFWGILVDMAWWAVLAFWEAEEKL